MLSKSRTVRVAAACGVLLICVPVAGAKSRGGGCKKAAKSTEYEQPQPTATETVYPASQSPSPSPTY
jgi:hypothetical protein